MPTEVAPKLELTGYGPPCTILSATSPPSESRWPAHARHGFPEWATGDGLRRYRPHQDVAAGQLALQSPCDLLDLIHIPHSNALPRCDPIPPLAIGCSDFFNQHDLWANGRKRPRCGSDKGIDRWPVHDESNSRVCAKLPSSHGQATCPTRSVRLARSANSASSGNMGSTLSYSPFLGQDLA